MKDLDEAIQHCEEVAEENEEIYEAHCRIYSKEVVEKYPSPPCKKCAEEHQQLAEWLRELKAYKEQGGDAISRQATVERLVRVADFMNEKRRGLGSPYVMAALFIQDNKDEFPSVTPQQRTGRWKAFTHSAYHGNDEDGEPIWREVTVYHCNLCNRRTVIKEKYCPNCGAKMEVKE